MVFDFSTSVAVVRDNFHSWQRDMYKAAGSLCFRSLN